MADYRRAREADPLWFRTTGQLAIATAEMGQRGAAESIAQHGMARDDDNRRILLGRVASIVGDNSEAIHQWSIVQHGNSPRWSETAGRNLQEALYTIGLPAKLAPPAPRAPDMRHRGHVLLTSAPSATQWRAQNRDRFAADVYRVENRGAAKLMLNADRWRELVATYDGPTGLLSIRAGQPLRVDQVGEVPIVILALNKAGRRAEAARLQREANDLVASTAARGPVPFWFDADAAELLAVSGRSDAAVGALERPASLPADWRPHHSAPFARARGNHQARLVNREVAVRICRCRQQISERSCSAPSRTQGCGRPIRP